MAAEAGGPPDAVDLLYKACEDDEFPTDMNCLQTFMFDRWKDWSMLLGLWQGIRIIHHWGQPFDTDEERRQLAQHIAAAKQQLRQAVADGRMFEYMEEKYIAFNQEQGTSSGYWQWYLRSKTQLMERANAAQTPPAVGRRVRLKGLAANPQLNGAAGTVEGVVEGNGRFAVRLSSPPSAVALQPDGVRVQPANLEVLPPGAALAVLISGMAVGSSFAFGTPSTDGWIRCPVPAMLGLPLAYRCMGGPPQKNERIAALLTIDPKTGLTRKDVKASSMGTVLVARTDGRDFTPEEMRHLHDYNCRLMELWQEGQNMTPHLTPAAYQAYTIERRLQFVFVD